MPMRQHNDPRFYWFALQTVPGIGARRYQILIGKFGAPDIALAASVAELRRLPDIGEKLIDALKTQVDWDTAERQLEQLEKSNGRLLTLIDPEYPAQLRAIYDPPPLLFVRGSFQPEDQQAVAIVGSRTCTSYGRQIAERLAIGLVERGMTIVSGLARGIDSLAQGGAIKAGGRTIGVLGCGLDVVYPPENERLYDAVAESGALVSEFFFGVKPDKHNFPSRNRIISGLSLGVIVIEAGKSSGALLTAKHALEQNREVFAVPGNISSAASVGTNDLLKQGAIPVTNTADVLLALGFDPHGKPQTRKAPPPDLPETESLIWKELSDQPTQVDKLAASLNLPVADVLTKLLTLEMSGLVRQLPGKLFVREH
ncbi:MAG: DNA-processing protein DprA [bacterium]